ncbi:hypothetical protein J43TS9_32270 [Paenibacillus cineris]|nr:hypothetical protein J43TS9_32270 [Paenibacillus cineris]
MSTVYTRIDMALNLFSLSFTLFAKPSGGAEIGLEKRSDRKPDSDPERPQKARKQQASITIILFEAREFTHVQVQNVQRPSAHPARHQPRIRSGRMQQQ